MFSVWNAGQEVLHYEVADDAAWLSVTPASGSLDRDSKTRSRIPLSFSLLDPGTHEATVSVTSTNALNSPLSLPVVVTVTSNVAPRITQLQVGAIPGGGEPAGGVQLHGPGRRVSRAAPGA